MATFYLAFDVDRIQRSIFESNWLPLVRAGSLLLAEQTAEKNITELLRDPSPAGAAPQEMRVIFASGGGGLLEVNAPDGQAVEQVARALERRFTADVQFTSLTTAWIDKSLRWQGSAAPTAGVVPRFDALPGTDFGRTFRRLNLILEERKRGRAAVSVVELPGWWGQPCTSCGLRPAVSARREGRRLLCPPCARRCRYHDDNPDEGYLEIEAVADERGQIGLICFDGNAVGSARECAADRGEEQLKQFARALRSAIHTGLRAVEQRRVEGGVNPLALSLGGDDVALIVPGKSVLQVLRTFESRVRQALAQRRDVLGDITFGAGAVVAPSHTPIPFLHAYAEKLCTNAKALWRHQKGESTWTCDLAVLTGSSPLGDDIDAIRRREFAVERAGEQLLLSCGPWTLEGLWQRSNALRSLESNGVSTSVLRELAAACHRMTRHESMLVANAQWARHEPLRRWVSEVEIYKQPDDFPWRESKRWKVKFETDLGDLVRWRGRIDPINEDDVRGGA
jgi:hypothetical protein